MSGLFSPAPLDATRWLSDGPPFDTLRRSLSGQPLAGCIEGRGGALRERAVVSKPTACVEANENQG